MPIVVVTSVSIEEYLELDRRQMPRPKCLACGRTMQGWSGYPRRSRQRRDRDGSSSVESASIFIGRVHCPDCNWTPALLPTFLFSRRHDVAADIGMALVLLGRGARIATPAQAIDRPPSTVRDWYRRLHEQAPLLGHGMAALVVAQGGASPGTSAAAGSASRRSRPRVGRRNPTSQGP